MGSVSDLPQAQAETQRASFTAPEAEVLVVDDFPSNLMVAEGLLTPYGMRVSTCLNGREAVEMVGAGSFDLVLMDHMMPEMDGVEATHAIRAMDETRLNSVPIIALTANAVAGMREMFLENGFNDFISKPIATSKLDAVLKKWIPEGKRRAAPEGAAADSAPADPPEAALPDIEGVDPAVGLARVGGSRAVYMELLEVFRRDAAAGAETLRNVPDEKSLGRFTTLVHALKSALANIGADGLSRDAARLETAGREADLASIAANLPRFRDELASLAERIGRIPKAAPGPGGGPAPEAVAEALVRLQTALETRDIEAIYAGQEALQGLPFNGEDLGAVSEISDLILTMEYGPAAEAVKSLRRRMALPGRREGDGAPGA
jgi:CheY-like chemotaxis protein